MTSDPTPAPMNTEEIKEKAAKLIEWADADVMETFRDGTLEPNDIRSWADMMREGGKALAVCLATLDTKDGEIGRWRSAVQSLTPRGSEFTTPEAVVAFVAREREARHTARVRAVEAGRRATAAEAERDRLRAALAPFADVVADEEASEDFPDETRATLKFGRTTHYAITLGDLRRARDALAGAATKGGSDAG